MSLIVLVLGWKTGTFAAFPHLPQPLVDLLIDIFTFIAETGVALERPPPPLGQLAEAGLDPAPQHLHDSLAHSALPAAAFAPLEKLAPLALQATLASVPRAKD